MESPDKHLPGVGSRGPTPPTPQAWVPPWRAEERGGLSKKAEDVPSNKWSMPYDRFATPKPAREKRRAPAVTHVEHDSCGVAGAA